MATRSFLGFRHLRPTTLVPKTLTPSSRTPPSDKYEEKNRSHRFVCLFFCLFVCVCVFSKRTYLQNKQKNTRSGVRAERPRCWRRRQHFPLGNPAAFSGITGRISRGYCVLRSPYGIMVVRAFYCLRAAETTSVIAVTGERS